MVLFAGCFVVYFVSQKWTENFFQSLENVRKIFPIIGKNGRNFPTIGNFFSNHWKTCDLPMSQQIVQGAGEKRKGRKGLDAKVAKGWRVE